MPAEEVRWLEGGRFVIARGPRAQALLVFLCPSMCEDDMRRLGRILHQAACTGERSQRRFYGSLYRQWLRKAVLWHGRQAVNAWRRSMQPSLLRRLLRRGKESAS